MRISLFARSPEGRPAAEAEDVPRRVALRAEDLFRAREALCAEAVLWALNSGLRGGLPPEHARRLASGFPKGMGGAGCACGALSGAVLGLGLFLGPTRADRRSAAGLRRLTRELYRRFIGEFGSACCGALCRASKGSGRSHFRQCTAITGRATQIAADIILRVKPEILKQLDGEFLARPGARMDAGLRRMMAQVVGER